MFLFMDYKKRKLEEKIKDNYAKLVKIKLSIETHDYEKYEKINGIDKNFLMKRLDYKYDKVESSIVKFQMKNQKLNNQTNGSIFSTISSFLFPCSKEYAARESAGRHLERADRKLNKLLNMYKFK